MFDVEHEDSIVEQLVDVQHALVGYYESRIESVQNELIDMEDKLAEQIELNAELESKLKEIKPCACKKRGLKPKKNTGVSRTKLKFDTKKGVKDAGSTTAK